MGGTIDNNGRAIQRVNRPNNVKVKILIADFILSSMWVFSSSIIDLIILRISGSGHYHIAEGIKCFLKVANMFLFAVIGSINGEGGCYNPLPVLADAISANFNWFLFTLFARIPAQVFGSIVGVKILIATFSNVKGGSNLNVEVHHGALTEGILAFTIAIISMGLARTLSASFYRKHWILCISKISLHVLGSELTGACMNPATVMGWAYAKGDHITEEHILVYWLAPVEATLVAVWIFNLLFQMGINEKAKKKTE
ncbi:hypothetical protein V2J09_014409 [Rumex salicifolius]